MVAPKEDNGEVSQPMSRQFPGMSGFETCSLQHFSLGGILGCNFPRDFGTDLKEILRCQCCVYRLRGTRTKLHHDVLLSHSWSVARRWKCRESVGVMAFRSTGWMCPQNVNPRLHLSCFVNVETTQKLHWWNPACCLKYTAKFAIFSTYSGQLTGCEWTKLHSSQNR